jgi:hypothetical protein
MILGMGLKQNLEQLEAWFKKNHRSAHGALQPGLNNFQLDTLLSRWNMKIPLELRELYKWHNGMEDELIHFLPGMSFYPLERGFEIQEMYQAMREQGVQKGTFLLPENAMPVFGDFNGYVIFYVEGITNDFEYASIKQFVINQGDLGYAYPNMSLFAQITLTCYEQGVYTVDKKGDDVMMGDQAAFGKIISQASGGMITLQEPEEQQNNMILESEDNDSDDDSEEEDGDDMFSVMLGMMGLSLDDMNEHDFEELLENFDVEGLPTSVQERYAKLKGISLEELAAQNETARALPEVSGTKTLEQVPNSSKIIDAE